MDRARGRGSGRDDGGTRCSESHLSHFPEQRHQTGDSKYPMVPGHEIVGLVAAVGAEVNKFKVGDKVRTHVCTFIICVY